MLEAAIAADFEDTSAHAAYADYLIESGDPRGEYIQLRLALENRDQSPQLLYEWEDRAERLRQQYQSDWLGPLAPFLIAKSRTALEPMSPNIEFKARFGWVTEIDVQDVRDAFTTVLAGAREARMLQSLTLRNTLLPNNHGPLEALERAPFLPTLKSFSLGQPDQVSVTASGVSVVPLIKRMTELRNLSLAAGHLSVRELCRLPFPHLESLAIDAAWQPGFAELAANSSLGRLQRLLIRQQDINDVVDDILEGRAIEPVIPDELRAFLIAPHLDRLNHLTVQNMTFGDAGCTEVVRSGVLRRLKELDLRNCGITDVGAVRLADCPDLAHLDRLDIGQNRLTGIGVDALLAVGIAVQYDSQWGEYLEMPPVEEDEAV